MNIASTQQLWLHPPFGAEDGIGTESDALPRVTQTSDGVDLNSVWQTMQQALDEWNKHRSNLVDVLSFWTTAVADALPQGWSETLFEEASEFGEPTSSRPPSEHVLVGYTLKDLDRASRYSWRALRAMDERQVLAYHNDALNADNAQVTKTILQRLFSDVVEYNDTGHACYGLWTGTDGMTPPKSATGYEFPSNHTHYRTTGSLDIDSEDVEEAIRDLRQHAFGLADSNQRILLLVNEDESEKVQSWRAGVENSNSAVAKWDFIPAVNQPSFILQGGGQLLGNQPSGTIFNLSSVGAYGPASVVESSAIPVGYFAVIATSGPGSLLNPVGVREHTLPAYRGFRQIPGTQPGYPLQESFYTRAFGVGIRQRGAALCYQCKTSGAYEVPEILPGSALAG